MKTRHFYRRDIASLGLPNGYLQTVTDLLGKSVTGPSPFEVTKRCNTENATWASDEFTHPVGFKERTETEIMMDEEQN